MKIQMVVCDVCNDPDSPVETYEIKSQGKNVKVELCEAHAQPFEAYLKDAKPRGRAAAKKTAASRKRSPRVTTLEEIEKLKTTKKK